MNLRTIFGTLLMFVSLITACTVLFVVSWQLGTLFCCFVAYRVGVFLSEQKIELPTT